MYFIHHCSMSRVSLPRWNIHIRCSTAVSRVRALSLLCYIKPLPNQKFEVISIYFTDTDSSTVISTFLKIRWAFSRLEYYPENELLIGSQPFVINYIRFFKEKDRPRVVIWILVASIDWFLTTSIYLLWAGALKSGVHGLQGSWSKTRRQKNSRR